MSEIAWEYNRADHSFLVIGPNMDEIVIPYLQLDKDNNGEYFMDTPEEYDHLILYKSDYSENDIYQVYEQSLDSRIGWLFPISAIISESNDYVDNPHFCRYSYVAYQIVISRLLDPLDLLSVDFEDLINEKFVDENAIIFIYKKSLVQAISDFNPQNYYAAFYRVGYYLNKREINPEIQSPANSTRLKLKSISSFIKDNPYLETFFKDLYFEKYPVIRFHLLYQVVELLIEDILIYNLERTISDFRSKRIYTRSLREKISKVETEKDRMSILMEWGRVSLENYEDLHEKCHSFITAKGRPECSFPDSLYAFRNFVVHDFRHMTTDTETVNEINNLFELFIFDLMLDYSHGNLTP